MCIGGSTPAPAAPAPVAKLPEAPQTPGPAASAALPTAATDARRRALSTGQASSRSTVLTGARGIDPSMQMQSGAKTLLGQ